MANPEHVEIVKQGAAAIAAWREKNPDTWLDLSEADLRAANLEAADLHRANLNAANLEAADLRRAQLSSANLEAANLRRAQLNVANLIFADLRGADLSNANLSSADLRLADLSGAKLSGGDLSHAYLSRADLSHADLSLADLSEADLSLADLSEADLSDANLHRTNLTSAKLNKANLSGACFGYTSIGDANMAEVVGLGEVRHRGPSFIGFDTLLRSQGKIPDVFLRGCGAPEELIVQLPAIIGSMEPIQFYSCFISYSSDDDAFARRLHARLTAEKLRVWFAPKDMKGGEKVAAQIDTAIRVHDRLLLVLSEKSMDSEWVRREIEQAREKEKQIGQNVLFPIALVPFEKIRAWKFLDVDSGEDLAKKVRAYHIPDFSEWKREDAFEKAFADLMRDLRAKTEVKTS